MREVGEIFLKIRTTTVEFHTCLALYLRVLDYGLLDLAARLPRTGFATMAPGQSQREGGKSSQQSAKKDREWE